MRGLGRGGRAGSRLTPGAFFEGVLEKAEESAEETEGGVGRRNRQAYKLAQL